MEEAPQEVLQPLQAEQRCLMEPPHQGGLSYQRPTVKQKSRNEMDQSPQQTGRQPPLLMPQLLPLLLSPPLPLNQNLFLLPQWKHQPLLLNLPQPQPLLPSLPLPLLRHLQ